MFAWYAFKPQETEGVLRWLLIQDSALIQSAKNVRQIGTGATFAIQAKPWKSREKED